MRFSALWIPISVLFLALATAAGASERLFSGQLEGRSRHSASGGVSIVATPSGHVLLLEGNFRFDGAPDPKLGFGQDGFVEDSLFAPLRRNQGLQAYALPDAFDPSRYDELWIWCERFGVPLGVARLEPS